MLTTTTQNPSPRVPVFCCFTSSIYARTCNEYVEAISAARTAAAFRARAEPRQAATSQASGKRALLKHREIYICCLSNTYVCQGFQLLSNMIPSYYSILPCNTTSVCIFYKHISRTSAMSSTNFGSILIFACCVVGTCNILCG